MELVMSCCGRIPATAAIACLLLYRHMGCTFPNYVFAGTVFALVSLIECVATERAALFEAMGAFHCRLEQKEIADTSKLSKLPEGVLKREADSGK